MRCLLVGGAVRDQLLGRPVGDRDWVVVGATPEQMVAAGYLPVGRDFPVFLHPRTHEEYALARTERKTAPGYHGFVFHTGADVSLDDDLARRDLTINAMALDEAGTLIDPWGGRRDLAHKCLRHVGAAFAEDPVRILRLARFAARLGDFSVAPETLALCRRMVEAGEVDALVPERVWQELSRGLMEARPSRMFEVLRDCGALARLLPEVERLFGVPQRADYHPEVDTGVHLMMVLDTAAQRGVSLPVRYACLGHDLGKGTTPAHILPRHIGHEGRSAALLAPMSARLKVPAACHELADLVAREHSNVHGSGNFDAAALVRLFDRCDAWRRPERFELALQACECDARGRLGFEQAHYPQAPRLRQALAAARGIDAAAVMASARARGLNGPALGRALHEARIEAVASDPACQRPADQAQQNG
ncbi:polynucleotide adenylyltransferase/metal dependent phosphohydrolase [Leptothrix cholodnii SP-6]|uniref:Multifunctional CCA protein n=1 Tax=Leptothrix cholodnii (strain ATCC 51168 / LMG 8142 / SP-6) TaxID=395495 RepID=CCA_LEPCP|nr:multifunctional CCA addition/repair protein [Leptothrix cholodnii]B1Y634.1 RecName: Full=Multifunctional CCA protein; Includes: RecName: Full=CCA-adding enzyme; AltName: Full=CCA tRNA nucleotidyltransferase; AltName: Full=tRNA CCA-pyrophosphorylase; AltName: Full=tRNA adenylyl-/cytidylyl-transferase; AltName: Full=tRNA nucleotidyltransferase; AltName: Full=tRNA-NT; Includes: RecName: Full=2'-nucleotidase; Includes: RecName: Full=2',3'-cyclic phosphodiesterase; Includes: RecName: Full=Phosphatas